MGICRPSRSSHRENLSKMRAAAAANVCHPNDGPGPAPAPMTESGRAAGQQSKARGAFLIPTAGSHSQAGLTNRCGQIFQLMGTRLSIAPSEKKTHMNSNHSSLSPSQLDQTPLTPFSSQSVQ